MTAPTQTLQESDIVQLRDQYLSQTGHREYNVNGNPPVFQDCGGGPSRPSSGIVYP